MAGQTPQLYPLLTNADEKRERIREHLMSGIEQVFPLEGTYFKIELVSFDVQRRVFSPTEQKRALLEQDTLTEPLRGTLRLIDKRTGEVVDEGKRTLVHIPYFTERHTFVVKGNEYSVSNQVRIKPGVYTRRRGNGELEAAFNLGKGKNFRLEMDPERGLLFARYDSTRIALYPVLRALGLTAEQIARALGKELADVNRNYGSGKELAEIKKLYGKLVPYGRKKDATLEEMVEAIKGRLDSTVLDPDVTQMTLGDAYSQVTPASLLGAARKLVRVFNELDEPDDRDSLAFKTLHTAETFFKERILKEARRDLTQKVKRKLNQPVDDPRLNKFMPAAPFSDAVQGFLTTSTLSSTPTQINPMEVIDAAVKVTSLGEGGISSTLAVPDEARDVHGSHFGILDPVRTPESGKAGIDIRATLRMARDDAGNMYTPLRNLRTGTAEYVSAVDLMSKNVAFHGQEDRIRAGKSVDVLHAGKVKSVPGAQVDYAVPFAASMYSPTTNLVPMLDSAMGNRNIMGAKFQTQALPLVEREAPLVQVGSWNAGTSVEREFARMIAPVAPVAGVVEDIDDDFIYIRPDFEPSAPSYGVKTAVYSVERCQTREKTASIRVWCGPGVVGYVNFDKNGAVARTYVDPYADVADVRAKLAAEVQTHINAKGPVERKVTADGLVRIPYSTNFPLMSKTFVHDEVGVAKGARVAAGDSLGDNNFTRNGTLALGKNLEVAYMAYKGLNSNDAVVISESAARKMTSQHMYKESMSVDKKLVLDRVKHRTYFGSRYSKREYDKLDDQGVIRKGQRVEHGDIVIAAMRENQATAQAQMLGKLHKSLVRPYRDVSITWEHESPGEVVDVAITRSSVVVSIRSEEPVKIGDKLANRFGAKGVVAKIIPDEQMIRNEAGQPVDVLLTSAGIISRVNPSQIIETAVAKVAKKTGQPVVIPQQGGQDHVAWAKALLKEHGIKDKETMFDPVTGRKIPGIMTGPQYTFKPFKSTDTNFAARGIGPGYDANLQPSKGGDEGAKSFGKMEFNALIAHNARSLLREVNVKGQKNDEFWKRVQLGLPAPPPTANFAFTKFQGMLNGAGIKVNREGSRYGLAPLTDKDIDAMASSSIQNARLVRTQTGKGAAHIAPEQGGLFDPGATGGLAGTKFSKIELAEPVVNPIFEEPARRLLDMSKAEFQRLRNAQGAAEIKRRLNALNLAQIEEEAREKLKTSRGSTRNVLLRKIKYIQALRRENLNAGDAYVLTRIPVTPPTMRPLVPNPDGTTLVADANYLYRDLLLANEAVQEMPQELLDAEGLSAQRQHMHDAVGALFGTNDPVSPQNQGRGVKGHLVQITGAGSPKGGYFQSKLVKRRQDLTGRATIAPDPTLDIDQIGLPEPMGWKMYEPFIIKRLVQSGYKPLDARKAWTDKTPAARRALEAEIQQRPVLFNRAPTLHRYNVVAAYPQLIKGKTLRINPFAEGGMNADYDGDAVQLHVPVSDGAVRDAAGMTLSNLVFGDKSRDSLMVFPAHEAIIGNYMATNTVKSGPVKRFKTVEEAKRAYYRNEIDMSSPVEIEELKK